MTLESTSDWMAFLSHRMFELSEAIGDIPKASTDWRIEEDFVNLEDEINVTVRRFVQRAQGMKSRARDAKENFEKQKQKVGAE